MTRSGGPKGDECHLGKQVSSVALHAYKSQNKSFLTCEHDELISFEELTSVTSENKFPRSRYTLTILKINHLLRVSTTS
ncbi:Uncharacterised protein [uncultured Blautia sp.]|nr:Uncharacterised protein [uncultured Blautia sp.]